MAEWVRELPSRVPRLGTGARLIGVVLLVLPVCVTPPGQFVFSHVGQQIREVLHVLRDRPDDAELRRAVLGTDYLFMSFIAERTEEDAIILMSDQFAFSELQPLKGKSQHWATYFLYPRRVLYLHQEEIPWYRDATWLVMDGPASVDWIEPSIRPEYAAGELRLTGFLMGRYLDLVASGDIDPEWLPPSEPLRPPKSER